MLCGCAPLLAQRLSVPTLADLLSPPDQRPKSFVRGLDMLDPEKGWLPGTPLQYLHSLPIKLFVSTPPRLATATVDTSTTEFAVRPAHRVAGSIC